MPQTELEQPRFLGALDTVDCKDADTPRTAAELQLSLLFGQKILLSQTQAFDGKHFLKLAAGKHNDDFLGLIEKGNVLIHLQQDGDSSSPPSLCKLLAAKVAQPGFHLCGWPEIPQPCHDSPQADFEARLHYARIMSEAIQGAEQGLQQLDEAVAARWLTLRRIDEAIGITPAAKRHSVAQPALRRTLDEEIKALVHTPLISPKVRTLLLASALKGTNSRSCYYKDINRAKDLDAEQGISKGEREEAHELVNGEYNRVVAHSLAAEPNLVASGLSISRTLRENAADEVCERTIEEAPEYADRLEGLSWERLMKLMGHLEDTSRSMMYRADAIKEHVDYAAQEVTDYEGKRKVKIVLCNVAASEFVSIAAEEAFKAATATASHVIAHAFTVPPDLLLLSQPMALALASYLTGHELGFKSFAKEYLKSNAVNRHRREIINIVKRHPHYPHTPGA